VEIATCTKLPCKILNHQDHLGDLGVDIRMILQLTLNKLDVKVLIDSAGSEQAHIILNMVP
jgi:hypothetical protein